jgi:hypothetical protein
MANHQILATKMLDECCFPGSSDSHHGNNDVIWTIGRQLRVSDGRAQEDSTYVGTSLF